MDEYLFHEVHENGETRSWTSDNGGFGALSKDETGHFAIFY
jgi:hypothetical protein